MPSARKALALLLLALLGPAGEARAVDFLFPIADSPASFEFTGTLVSDLHIDNHDGDPYNDNYQDLRSRINLLLAIDRFTASVRADTASFIHRPSDAIPPYLDRYGLEKAFVAWNGRRFQVQLGDNYVSFGRGIALNIRKTDELGQDTTLLGGKLRLQTDRFEATLVGGLTNATNNDALHEKTIQDPYDLITGLSTLWRLEDASLLSLYGAAVLYDPLDRNDQTQLLPRRAFVAGTSFEVPDISHWGNLYLEVDWLGVQTEPSRAWEEALEFAQGWAGYLDWNLFFENWTISLDFKTYHDFELYGMTASDGRLHYVDRIDYISPPTLEPADAEVINNTDVTGALFSADWRPGGGEWLLSLSYAGFLAEDLNDQGDRWIYHAWLMGEYRLLGSGKAQLSLGTRNERANYPTGEDQDIVYLKAILKVPLGGGHSLDLHGFNWWAAYDGPLGQSEYLKGEWTLAWAWSPYMDISAIVSWDTKPSGSRTLTMFYEPQGGDKLRQVFLAGSASVHLFDDALVLKLLGGFLRGGLKCVAGGCRDIPSFSGVRLETIVRF